VGAVVRSEVVGALKMRTYLSGMPECKLGLNDKVLFEAQGRGGRGRAVDLEDVKFHQCVRLASFERDRTISFVPPDGAFDLMTYRLSQNVKPLIWVECAVERHSRSRTEYLVKARSLFKERSAATSVEIVLPLPPDAIAPVVRASVGSAAYAPERAALVWKIKNFPGGREFMLRCKFGLPSVEAEEEPAGRMPPIKIRFEIPYFSVSGIQVRWFKVVKRRPTPPRGARRARWRRRRRGRAHGGPRRGRARELCRLRGRRARGGVPLPHGARHARRLFPRAPCDRGAAGGLTLAVSTALSARRFAS
jgi:AP-1 complex subunit mu